MRPATRPRSTLSSKTIRLLASLTIIAVLATLGWTGAGVQADVLDRTEVRTRTEAPSPFWTPILPQGAPEPDRAATAVPS